MIESPPLHEDVRPLEFLIGAWRGEGAGRYPTVDPFSYGEEVRFWHIGRPFLAYSQTTWSLADGSPMHGETGFWRPKPEDRLEVVLAHPSGIVEVEEGRVVVDRGVTTIELATATVGQTTTAKRVDALTRSFRIEGDSLSYSVGMAAVGQSLQHHLGAELHRVAD
ncbi:MAG: FABP family protein [Actinomycetota bacterium]|nr:FABP family protein [Actinomycetota bacterium]